MNSHFSFNLKQVFLSKIKVQREFQLFTEENIHPFSLPWYRLLGGISHHITVV